MQTVHVLTFACESTLPVKQKEIFTVGHSINKLLSKLMGINNLISTTIFYLNVRYAGKQLSIF